MVVVLRGIPRFHAAIELIGRRWNGVILQQLTAGSSRYSALRARVPGITDAMLSQRLRELEDAGLVVRDVLGVKPVEVHYVSRRFGQQLTPILEAVAAWSTRWMRPTADQPDLEASPD